MKRELKAEFEKGWEESCRIGNEDWCYMCGRGDKTIFQFDDGDPAYGFSCCEECLVEILKRLRATKKRGAH